MKTWEEMGINDYRHTTGQERVQCPKCTHTRRPENQRRRDLSINHDERLWYCHHCEWSGTLKSGEDNAPNWTVPPAPPAKKKTYEKPRSLPEVTIPTLWDKTKTWFETRGIPEEILNDFGVTANSEYCGACDAEVGHVLFPYYVAGKHVNTKHRCGKKHFRMEKGAERVLYNTDACIGADTIVIVEGEIDALSVATAGIKSVVSVPDGAPAVNAKGYAGKFSFLESAEKLLEDTRQFIIAVDKDEPGYKLRDELIRRLGPERCRVVDWPDGTKDANECLLKYGASFLKMTINLAEMVPVEGIITAYELGSELEHLYEHGIDPGLKLGYMHLDNRYRVKPGYMTIVTGIPNHGKSGAMNQFLVRLAEKYDWRIAVFSPEQQPTAMHVQELMSIYTGKPFNKGWRERMTPEEMHRSRRWVGDHFSFLNPEEPSVSTLLDLARIEVFRKGVNGLIIDPYNELEHMRPPHMSETEYISDLLSRFRRFAILHKVHVWIVAHPTKLRKNEEGAEPVPGLYDISGSAHFRNKADMGMTIWRDITASDSTLEVHITKVRFAEMGKLGTVKFDYDPATKRLKEREVVS